MMMALYQYYSLEEYYLGKQNRCFFRQRYCCILVVVGLKVMSLYVQEVYPPLDGVENDDDNYSFVIGSLRFLELVLPDNVLVTIDADLPVVQTLTGGKVMDVTVFTEVRLIYVLNQRIFIQQ